MTATGNTFPTCAARKRDGSGGVCALKAGWGTDHVGFGRCKLHGGANPSGRKSASIIRARMEVAEWGARMDITPAEALLELVQTKAAEVAYWTYRVGQLTDADRAGLIVSSTTDEQGQGPQGSSDKSVTVHSSDLNVFLKALHKAQEQLATFSAAALRAGVDEALVRIAAVQASAVIDFARKAMALARQSPKADPDRILLELVERESH